MWMTLAERLKSTDEEPEEATFCSESGPPVKRQEHQPINKTFDPKFILSLRNAGMEQRLKANQNPAQLEIHPMDKHQSLTLSMRLCYACWQEPSITVLWKALPSSRLKQTQISTAKHCMDPKDTYGRLGGRTEGPKWEGNATRKQQSQVTWTPGISQTLSHQPKNIQGLEGGPYRCVVDVWLSFHVRKGQGGGAAFWDAN